MFVPPHHLHTPMRDVNHNRSLVLKSWVNNAKPLNGRKKAVCDSPDRPKYSSTSMDECSPPTVQWPPHSQAFEEFIRNEQSTFKLEFVRGHCVEFAVDQRGSRFIQQATEQASCRDRQAIFDEILPETLKLTNDIFGNYVIQKFFEFGTSTQKLFLLEKLQESILVLAKGVYGCRVIQKAIEVLPPEMQVCIVHACLLCCIIINQQPV